VAEARPATAQSESVVLASNPHQDSKLSSAEEITADPLETARPGFEEPIASARDQRSGR
jgi:hypothetical protein